jgi:putative glycosyltransferase
MLYFLGRYSFWGVGVDGFTSVIVSIWFLGGLTTLILGILGIYIANIMAETKRRPYTIVRRVHRADSLAAAPPNVIRVQGHAARLDTGTPR